MNVYVLDIAPLRGREREALALLPEERGKKALRIRREEARLRSIGASLLLRAAKIAPVRRAAPRALTLEERKDMEADPERRFAYLWTRKEAVLKCTGAGLSQPMNAFSVLGDTASPEGALLSLYTVEYGNYMLSAAAARSAVFTPQRVDALELL